MVFFFFGDLKCQKIQKTHINAQNEHNRMGENNTIDTMARKRDCQRYEYVYDFSLFVSLFKIEIK